MSKDGVAAAAGSPSGEGGAPSLRELFLGFSKIAAFAFGGVLPWARYMLVEQRGWLSPDEFTDTLALCQLLPGPNIVNMAVAVGARFRGAAGAVVSVLGLLVLPVAIVLTLVSAYARFADAPAVNGALRGMAAAAAGLIVAMAVKIAGPVLRRGIWPAAPVIAAMFVAIAAMRLALWPTILVLAPISVALHWSRR